MNKKIKIISLCAGIKRMADELTDTYTQAGWEGYGLDVIGQIEIMCEELKKEVT